MSLFKDLKDDVSQAVNELMNDDEISAGYADDKTQTQEETEDLDAEMLALFGEDEAFDSSNGQSDAGSDTLLDDLKQSEKLSEMDATLVELAGDKVFSDDDMIDNLLDGDISPEQAASDLDNKMEEKDMSKMDEVKEQLEEKKEAAFDTANFEDTPADDEMASITKGTEITGNIKTSGSLEVVGSIEGDISCKGKLVVSGVVKGTSDAAEIFTDAANVTGDMNSAGSIKVGVGSVIVGNLTATSAVIAGAVKGDIDVNGPIIIDSTAVVMGNIKSRSVQVNNGAVMEGLCSQSYSDIDVNTFFEN